MQLPLRQCLIRIGKCTYHYTEGKLHDLGEHTRDSARSLAHQMRLALVSISMDGATLPCVYQPRGLGKPFAFDWQPEGIRALWTKQASRDSYFTVEAPLARGAANRKR